MHVFRRARPGHIRPGEYAQWSDSASGCLADLLCPHGHRTTLKSPRYCVSQDGAVTGLFSCPFADCGFREFIVLDRWVAP